MIKGIIGKKLNMSQTFDKHGRAIPITKVTVSPNVVLLLKTVEKDGYKKVQIGAEESKNASKPLLGHAKKAGLDKAPRYIHEIDSEGEIKQGQKISAGEVFKPGNLVDVRGLSKGKGFAGVIKRWGFAGGPKTHGQSDRERAPGSIGATTTPGRVFKGMKMAGHMGNQKVSIIGLEVVEINNDNNEILLKGSIPGAFGSFVLIEKSRKKKKSYQEPEIPSAPTVSGDKEEKEEKATEDIVPINEPNTEIPLETKEQTQSEEK